MKNSIDVINQRMTNILSLLQEKGQLTTDELSSLLNVSISTIRRDLIVMVILIDSIA